MKPAYDLEHDDDRAFGRMIREWRDEHDDREQAGADAGSFVFEKRRRLREMFENDPALQARFADHYAFRDFANAQYAGLFFDEMAAQAIDQCDRELADIEQDRAHWRMLIGEAIERGRDDDRARWEARLAETDERAARLHEIRRKFTDPDERAAGEAIYVSHEKNWSDAETRQTFLRRLDRGQSVSLADALSYLTDPGTERRMDGYSFRDRLLVNLSGKMVAGEFVATAHANDLKAARMIIEPAEWKALIFSDDDDPVRNPGGFVIEPTGLRYPNGSIWYFDVQIHRDRDAAKACCGEDAGTPSAVEAVPPVAGKSPAEHVTENARELNDPVERRKRHLIAALEEMVRDQSRKWTREEVDQALTMPDGTISAYISDNGKLYDAPMLPNRGSIDSNHRPRDFWFYLVCEFYRIHYAEEHAFPQTTRSPSCVKAIAHKLGEMHGYLATARGAKSEDKSILNGVREAIKQIFMP